MNGIQNKAGSAAEQSRAAWFVVLERARMDHDFARAAQAVRELQRLGVIVTYCMGASRAD
jgi:hypothetical protein